MRLAPARRPHTRATISIRAGPLRRSCTALLCGSGSAQCRLLSRRPLGLGQSTSLYAGLCSCLCTDRLPHTQTHTLTLSLTHSLTHSLNHSLTQPLNHSPTHPLTHSPTQPLNHSPTHPLTYMILCALCTHVHRPPYSADTPTARLSLAWCFKAPRAPLA